jgi:hypothetical protein
VLSQPARVDVDTLLREAKRSGFRGVTRQQLWIARHGAKQIRAKQAPAVPAPAKPATKRVPKPRMRTRKPEVATPRGRRDFKVGDEVLCKPFGDNAAVYGTIVACESDGALVAVRGKWTHKFPYAELTPVRGTTPPPPTAPEVDRLGLERFMRDGADAQARVNDLVDALTDPVDGQDELSPHVQLWRQNAPIAALEADIAAQEAELARRTARVRALKAQLALVRHIAQLGFEVSAVNVVDVAPPAPAPDVVPVPPEPEPVDLGEQPEPPPAAPVPYDAWEARHAQ